MSFSMYEYAINLLGTSENVRTDVCRRRRADGERCLVNRMASVSAASCDGAQSKI
jgi:hypothetical protein